MNIASTAFTLFVPMMAGPSAIALLLLLAAKHPNEMAVSALGVSLAWAASAVILLVSR